MRIDNWGDLLLNVLFFGLPLVVAIVGMLFVGKESPQDDRYWRLGKNDPFRRILHDENGDVREVVRSCIVIFLAIVLSAFIVIGILYRK